MFSDNVIENIPAWFNNSGPEADCVISTRARLARNVADHQFPCKASLSERKSIFDEVAAAIRDIPQCKDSTCLNFSAIERISQQFLFEKRVVSNELVNFEGDRGVICDFNNHISIMINEEDHIRMQCMDSGFQPDGVWSALNDIDDELGKNVGYAYDRKWGFLTSCPTNSGTGFRVSFLMHLPGLVLTKTVDSVLSGASQMGISTRGFFGEYSDVVGNMFQLSNQATMGACENEFLKSTKGIIKKIIGYEKKARRRVLKDAKNELEDKVYRSYGILKYARTLELDEFLNLTSAIRLGIECGIVKNITVQTLNRMILLCLPAHMELYFKTIIDKEEKSSIRADMVKKFLPEIIGK